MHICIEYVHVYIHVHIAIVSCVYIYIYIHKYIHKHMGHLRGPVAIMALRSRTVHGVLLRYLDGLQGLQGH